MPSSRGSSRLRDQTQVSCFTWASLAQRSPASSLTPSLTTQSHTGDLRDLGLIPESGRSPGERNDYPLQYSYLENPMDRRT